MAPNSPPLDDQPSPQAPPRPSLEPGRTTLGKYRIMRQLGAGGMGTVYLAADTQLKRTVALKVLPKERTDNETLVRRFESEAQSAAQLHHENIVTIYDAGRTDGHLFIALELVDGTDIYELVAKRGAIPLKRSIDFVRQVVRALDHLHKKGFVHRDIKPSNLLVTKEGTIKLTDMGLARAVDESLPSGITREGTTVGTVDYMAPEQARNSQAADIRSDIYSLGCTWYQMLTGEPPYPTGSVTNKLFSHISKPRPDPRSLNRTIPEEVVAIMHKMMARKPIDRYQTPQELQKDLEAVASGRTRIDEVLEPDEDIAYSRPMPVQQATLPPRSTQSRAGDTAQSSPEIGSGRAPLPRRSDEGPPNRTHPGRSGAHRASLAEESPGAATASIPPNQRQPPTPLKRRRGTISQQPVRARGESETTASSGVAMEWRPLAQKLGIAVGGLAVIGALVWAVVAWSFGPTDRRGEPLVKNPFEIDGSAQNRSADENKGDQPDGAKTEPASKPADKTPKVVLSSINDKSAAQFSVLGTPGERSEFPAWIADLWNPAPTSKAAPKLRTVFVGRTGKEKADFPSLEAAIQGLPEEGGVIALRGRGPFLLPAIRIANRKKVVIAGADAIAAAVSAANAKAKQPPRTPALPLIILQPGSLPDTGILATDTNLTIYGVDFGAFANQFSGTNTLRLIDVRGGDLTVQKSSLTLLGQRGSPTIAFAVTLPNRSASEQPPRVVFDRTLLRGRELTGIEADALGLDLLAINTLFVTGNAPAVSLLPGIGQRADKANARMLRLFSCTTVTDGAAVSVKANSDNGTPPTTEFRLLNSVFEANRSGAPTMVALNNWPTRPPTAETQAVSSMTWSCRGVVIGGFESLARADSGATLGVKDANNWTKFWGKTGSYESRPARATVSDPATADPAALQLAAVNGAKNESQPPGFDAAWLEAPSADILRRADVLAHRVPVPRAFQDDAIDGSLVREVNLDSVGRRTGQNLARIINQADWKSGTTFRVHGSGRKVCTPIHVVDRSFTIDFVDPAPPQMVLELPPAAAKKGGEAFITVSGGTVQLVHAHFRIEPSKKPLPRWLLDVRKGNYSIRKSRLEGPSLNNPSYEGLIHISEGSGDSAENDAPIPIGHIADSFLCTSQTAVTGDLSHSLILERSILAAEARVFDLHGGTLPNATAIELRSCTLACGGEFFRIQPDGSGRVQFLADSTVFAAPLNAARNGSPRAALFGRNAPVSPRGQIDWWDYACAFSDRIDFPREAGSGAPETLAGWQEWMGAGHSVRSIGDPNAVLLPTELTAARELTESSFRLKDEAQAKTWSDVGGLIGASLNAPPPSVALESHDLKSPQRKRSSKAVPQTTGGGL